jgi:hypothetical protein
MINPDDDFKLLALKPLTGCAKKYRNNLLPGTLYPLYKNYRFTPEMGPITGVEKLETDYGIFSDFAPAGINIKINVSEIVGKNGSGKSSLLELFYLCAYLAANAHGILKMDLQTSSGQREQTELSAIKEGLKLEVYFQSNEKYQCIVMDSDFVSDERGESDIVFYNLFGGDNIPMADFFYTIAVNYSLHGLNEGVVGAWLGRLFHKNDAYQTPIVLNPFREKGIINPNAEILFSQTRLLSNIRLNEEGAQELLPGRTIKEILFVIDRKKLKRTEGHANERVFEELRKESGLEKKEIFERIFTALLGEVPEFDQMMKPEWEKMVIDYSVTKLVRIAKNYPEYKAYYLERSEENVPCLISIETFLDKLKKDLTHVTLKLRQALNFFRNDPLRPNDPSILLGNNRISMPASLFAKRYETDREKYAERDPMEMVPIAPFSPKIILNDGQFFHQMSSGEQQLIHSVQAVLYHLLNLDSVFHYRGDSTRHTYPRVNIIFDEIELYFHPEYQRRFVSEILRRISKLEVPEITRFNLLFVTHSPFILSDIPATNVLHMENGRIIERNALTFAANVHQMLSDSFFMKSTIGDFAKYQFEQIILFYQKVRNAPERGRKDYSGTELSGSFDMEPESAYAYMKDEYQLLRDKFRFITDQIGEPVIRGVLENHIDFIEEKLSSTKEDPLTVEKERLEAKLEEINRKINNRP